MRSLWRDGLLDELALMSYPIVLGSGMRLFGEIGEQINIGLTDSKTQISGSSSAAAA